MCVRRKHFQTKVSVQNKLQEGFMYVFLDFFYRKVLGGFIKNKFFFNIANN